MTKEESQKKRRTAIKRGLLVVLGLAVAVEAGRLSASKEERSKLVEFGKKTWNSVTGLFTRKQTTTPTTKVENSNRNQYYGYKKPRFNN